MRHLTLAFLIAAALSATTTIPTTGIITLAEAQTASPSTSRPELKRDSPFTKKHTVTATEAQAISLPDITKPKVKREVRCSACRLTAKHAFIEARAMDDRKHHEVTDLDWVDMMDSFCTKIFVRRGGLLMRNNKATTTYSDVSEINLMSGGWVTSFLEDRCVEFIERNEEKIRKNYMALGSFAEMQNLMCQGWEKVCTEADVAFHEGNLTPIEEAERIDKEAGEFYEREKKKARAKAAKEKKAKDKVANAGGGTVPRMDGEL